ncbi:MAG: adenylate/guanylate cyclase domain-containing protein [Nitratireductor sp.]
MRETLTNKSVVKSGSELQRAPRLFKAFLLYVLPVLILSIGGMIFSINQSIGNAIESYQANLDLGIAEEALVLFKRQGDDGILNQMIIHPKDSETANFINEEGLLCLAVLDSNGEILKLYKVNSSCAEPAPDSYKEMLESGKPMIVEGGMVPGDWTSLIKLSGMDTQSVRYVAISRNAASRESHINTIATDWTMIFAALFSAACTALAWLVYRAQIILDHSFDSLADVERQLSRFVSRSAHAFAEGREGAARKFQAAVLFAGSTNFSGFAEKSDPEVTAALIDRFVSAGTKAVENHGGDVDKLLGDGLLAWFEGPDSVGRAMKAIAEISNGCADLDRRPGFGLMAGEIVAALVGSGPRRDFHHSRSNGKPCSRLCGIAAENEVAMSADVFNLGKKSGNGYRADFADLQEPRGAA